MKATAMVESGGWRTPEGAIDKLFEKLKAEWAEWQPLYGWASAEIGVDESGGFYAASIVMVREVRRPTE